MGGAIMNWLRASWDAVRTSLWLIPSIMFVLGVALAVGLVGLTLSSAESRRWAAWIASGNGEDARNLISTLLTAVIAMASIAFSVTVVALSLAANTYGSRLIRIFRADQRTQVVLGVFVMTIVYLLLVLRSLRGAAPPGAVPEIAVGVGSLMALLSVLALLAFIQGVASLIAADEVVRRVRHELDAAVRELPLLQSSPDDQSELPHDFGKHAAKIRLPREGYVQSVEYSKIVQWAEEHRSVVLLDFRPGDFVVEGDCKVMIAPAPPDPRAARKAIDRFIVSGERRTPTQDLEFALRHLVEVAVRALSPGINDPFTAMAVIDRLRGGLARLARRTLPPAVLTDREGAARVFRKVTNFPGAVDAAFNQIRQAASGNPSVLIHMLKAIEALAEHCRTQEQFQAFLRHAELAVSSACRNVDDPADLADVEKAYDSAHSALLRSASIERAS
jgi:uncharacterized membrane protein